MLDIQTIDNVELTLNLVLAMTCILSAVFVRAAHHSRLTFCYGGAAFVHLLIALVHALS